MNGRTGGRTGRGPLRGAADRAPGDVRAGLRGTIGRASHGRDENILLVTRVISRDCRLNLAITALYSAQPGQAWTILGGFGGQFSFGHAAFFETGAYGVAVLQVRFGINPWLGFVLAGGFAAAVAAFVGLSPFRYGLKGSSFALVTLAFAEVLRILSNSVDFTGAGVGILIPLDQRAAKFRFAGKAGLFWVTWAVTVAAFLAVAWLRNSRLGARLMAVRDNEDAARALGVDAFRVKMGALLVAMVLFMPRGLAGLSSLRRRRDA